MEQLGVDRPVEVIHFNSIKPNTLPHDKKYHIFLSYKTVDPDRRVAIQIDKLLRGKGYECCLHERDFLGGNAIVDNIEKNIESSIKVVFLLSENSSASEWCQYELTMTETFHIQNKGYKPIILKLDQCKLPDSIKRYTYILANRPTEEWIGRLALAINDETDHLITNRRKIKFVPVPCMNYNRDKEHQLSTCRYPHICAKYIIDDEKCTGSCGKNHNLVNNQSREILVDVGFITDGNYDSLLETYRQKCKGKLADMAKNGVTGPCCYYNYKGCLLGDFHCPFTHICKDWFIGTCVKLNCALSHDILNGHTTRLLKIFDIDTTNDKAAILNEYRAKYPHKTFITMKESVSTRTFPRENLLYVVVIVLIIVFFVKTYGLYI
ncbi:uncharacterized protein LOC134692939 [Mytilus trossulus]|uniref:uncharacterized protein LOC134692939 n=1 Tax=Mytilus trossulus TaxID=6551 RepID=UPI003005BAD4